MADAPTGTLIYPSAGVLDKNDGFSDPRAFRYAHMPSEDTITVVFTDDTEESFNIDPSQNKAQDNGFFKFSTVKGSLMVLRPVLESDGAWISDYGVILPSKTLRKLATKQEGNNNMPYLDDENERMVAFQIPDDEYIFGILYINKFGAYIRTNGSWIEVTRDDATFEDTYPYYVNKDTAEEFVSRFDSGLLKYNDVRDLLTDPED